jgi:hypothetical protein
MQMIFAQAATNDVLFWVAVLLGAVLSASIAILGLRKSLFAPARREEDSGSLMEQVRAMRERGEMSEAEYDQVRRKLVAKAASRASEKIDTGRGRGVDE